MSVGDDLGDRVDEALEHLKANWIRYSVVALIVVNMVHCLGHSG